MTQTGNRIEIANGNCRAVFIDSATPGSGEQAWTPDWFYLGDRPMLRFKDHEWLSIGHVKPTAAAEVEALPGGGAVFSGTALYGGTRVHCSTAVQPDPLGDGFQIDTVFTPTETIELLEAWATFETPYEYEGHETVTTVIGMNPVYKWRGAERLSPPIWENPAWIYSRPQSARITARCSTPFLCQAITDAPGLGDRFVTLIGDWNVCAVHDVYCAPTRDTPADPPSMFRRVHERKGYKYVVGALNWSSAYAKDPNVLFEGGEPHRQRVIVRFTDALPDARLDAFLYEAWARTAALDLPADGRVAAFDHAAARGVTWASATRWLRDVFCSDKPTEGLYMPGKGICTYAVGSRPKAGGDYSLGWWTQWTGALHYRARLNADEELERVCERIDGEFLEYSGTKDYFNSSIASNVSALPAIWWAFGEGRGGPIHLALEPMLRATAERSSAENGRQRFMDYGAQAGIAEALLLGGEAYGDAGMTAQARILLDEMHAKLDDDFWDFNMGQAGSLAHGGQIRSLGHGHALMANLVAFRLTGEARFLQDARRFARFLLAVCYATHNGSCDPDFDWRGWCNGSNAGRDQIADYPPWETQNGLLCIAALMNEAELEGGFYDALWYIARTGLAQFPAARRFKRILRPSPAGDPSMEALYVPRTKIASEVDFYDVLPYLAYENPHDQTLLASYQGTDCMIGELVYGGGLARSSDDRLGVLVPRATTMDMAELTQRNVHVWNPLSEAVDAQIAVTWPDGTTSQQTITSPPREVTRLSFEQ